MIPGVPKQTMLKTVNGKEKIQVQVKGHSQSKNQTPHPFDAETDTEVHRRETPGDSVNDSVTKSNVFPVLHLPCLKVFSVPVNAVLDIRMCSI